MNKCLGCGAFLQTLNASLDGYIIDENKKLCERCFKIKNYGIYKPAVKDKLEFDELLKNISATNDLVILVVDLFNYNPNLEIFNELKNDVILVFTKRDLLPKNIYDERLLLYVNNSNFNVIDKIMISSNKNLGFDLLMEKINNHKKSNNVYVIGFTNAGKSTMINKIIYNYSDLKQEITTSLLPNTTLDKIEVKINNDLTLIDTPGIVDDGSIYYTLMASELKKFIPKKEIKPITYQVHSKQTFLISGLLSLVLENNNITFYFSNNLEIKRFYKDIDTQFEKHEISVKKNEDVVISGLGFIKFTKKENIILYTLPGVLVYKRDNLI